ncbi:glycoside hydrolase family 97 protein [Pelomonas sp. SE-A7]|uniref:glycoside hydrolase family 97 protein n=1 Tax=Pelomonas sp. SE-A7 TaxID=3054953 RepID=UPI00259CCB6E|nr:glycoside hydrolase family 97 protein [Pelomonas sp. SE-A7]MDM4766772.1 glycoside hydrolase family 97 protein [Pelomonas sp. SE-A7]
MLSRLKSSLVLVLALVGTAALAAPAVELKSPDGRLSIAVSLDRDGRASYSVSRLGKPLIAPSSLGFLLADAPKLDRGFALESRTAATEHDERWEQPWGEQQFIRNRYKELDLVLREQEGLQRRLGLRLRAYDDGVALRYLFPEQPNLKQVQIGEELTEFNIASPGTAWWNTAFEWDREEYLYKRTPIEQVGLAQTPMTLRMADGVHLALHEAALVDYAGMNLVRVEDRRLKAQLTPGSGGQPKVVRTAPFATPWRMIQIADSAARLAESRLMLNLNEPNALGDVSWFKPMKYVGIWWEMHQNLSTWSSGPTHGATTANALRHIDFAARHGFGGVLIEGWNKGWDGNWVADSHKFSFTEPYADFDLERITAYASSKGVQLIGHHETGANAANYERQLGPALDLYARLGVGSIKTGYVADAAQAKVLGSDGVERYGWHEGQDMVRHHLKVVQEAAKRRIAINPHEPVKDTGLRRTYPNWISREGARGQEYNAWGSPGNPPEHEVNLVFTRLLSAPMDFTPGILAMKTQQPAGVVTTWAKQLALYVVIYSPIQMAADLLDNYEKHPLPFEFIKQVPVDWSETRVLNGEVGDYVTIARKQRGGEDWYLGAITDEHPRSLELKLDFLEPGARYRAHIYRDGPRANYTTAREDLVVERREVGSASRLVLRLAPGGGQAIRFEKLAGAR